MVDENKMFSEDYGDSENRKKIMGTSDKLPQTKQTITDKIDVSDKITKGLGSKMDKRVSGIIGIFVICAIVVGVFYLFGFYGHSEPFDVTKCHYGVHSDIFGLRCITEDEYKENMGEDITPTVTPSNQSSDEVPFKGIASTSDQVQVEKTNDILGYYLITSNGDWYSDYVDFRKLPSTIQQSGSQKISFRCYNDDFLKTSTYFATFRNVIEDYMKVQVFINDKLVQEQSTDVNRAIIVEGNCIQAIP